jgi:hypothetical protein
MTTISKINSDHHKSNSLLFYLRDYTTLPPRGATSPIRLSAGTNQFMTFQILPSTANMSSNFSKPMSTPASAGRKTRLSMMQKGDCNAPPANLGQYATPTRDVDPSVPQGQRDAPPSKEGRYATPATPGHDDKSATKSPISESASTIRKASTQRPFLGPQQIESLMKSQYGNKIGKPPASFATVLEQDREETPTPSEMPPSTRSRNSGGFKVLPTK